MNSRRFDVFLSYNGADQAAVDRIADWLRSNGLEPWFDRWALTPGRSWQEEIAEGLRASRACAVIVGPNGLGDWAREELAVAHDLAAKDRRFRIFLVLLPGAPELSEPSLAFLRTRTWVDLRNGSVRSEDLQDLVYAITGVPRPGVRVAAPAAATTHHNLPFPRSSFIGRDEELRELEKLTTTAAIVTVVGPGGSGKSRIALELAHRLSTNYTGGTWLVELESVSDPSLVPHAVATALGVGEKPGRLLTETVADALDHGTLLVLDNCEHLVDAVAALADTLVRAVPTLTVLATSREPLRVDGEVLWRIPTLAVPEADSMPAEAMIEYDAVRLFVERAAAQGNYTWGPASAAAVARVCRRLDGLPLAIELAAARTRALSPPVIAERLDDRFELLTAGARTALPRHQTLRATVDWSYELLRPPERVVFRRLSVFAGGCSLSAAEEVCAGEDLDAAEVLDLVAALVDRSLVRVAERNGALRFSMHETLRAYAGERLAEAGEEQALRARHLAWMLAFGELQQDALAPRLVTQKAALDRVEVEHDNIRQALRGALAADPNAALRLVASIGRFWRMRGHLAEGRRWTEAVLAAAPQGDMALRALVLSWAGSLALDQGDARHGKLLVEQSIASFRELGDAHAVALGLEQLIWPAVDDGDWSRAERLARQCIDIHTEVGDEHLASENMMVLAMIKLRRGDESTTRELMDEALDYNFRHPEDPCPALRARSGNIALLLGDFQHAKPRLEEAVRYSRDTGQSFHLSGELGWLGEVAFFDGDVEEAERLFAEQLSTAREQGAWTWTRHALLWLAKVAIRRGDVASARGLLEEVQRLSRIRGIATDPEELEAVAELLGAEGRRREAARLLGTAEALRESLGEPVPPAYRPEVDRVTSQVASTLESEAFAAAWAEGRHVASF